MLLDTQAKLEDDATYTTISAIGALDMVGSKVGEIAIGAMTTEK